MEQSLIDKIKQDKLDEVDKDMIAARIKNATITIMEECTNSIERISALFDEYAIEAKMAGLSCVFLVQPKMFHKNDGKSDACLVVGSTPNISAMLDDVKEGLKR